MRSVELACTVCPAGCLLTAAVDEEGEVRDVAGAACPRGREYAVQEVKRPRRVVVSVVRVVGGDMPIVSVKTDRPVDKSCIESLMQLLARVVVEAPVEVGQVILENVCGANIVATRKVRRVAEP
ncbi:MAG: DUF1667 domain-containing protein [Thermofilaceae archaeon]